MEALPHFDVEDIVWVPVLIQKEHSRMRVVDLAFCPSVSGTWGGSLARKYEPRFVPETTTEWRKAFITMKTITYGSDDSIKRVEYVLDLNYNVVGVATESFAEITVREAELIKWQERAVENG